MTPQQVLLEFEKAGAKGHFILSSGLPADMFQRNRGLA
jgi:hypothetical protein